jgi:hypothetical protein
VQVMLDGRSVDEVPCVMFTTLLSVREPVTASIFVSVSVRQKVPPLISTNVRCGTFVEEGKQTS